MVSPASGVNAAMKTSALTWGCRWTHSPTCRVLSDTSTDVRFRAEATSLLDPDPDVPETKGYVDDDQLHRVIRDGPSKRRDSPGTRNQSAHQTRASWRKSSPSSPGGLMICRP